MSVCIFLEVFILTLDKIYHADHILKQAARKTDLIFVPVIFAATGIFGLKQKICRLREALSFEEPFI